MSPPASAAVVAEDGGPLAALKAVAAEHALLRENAGSAAGGGMSAADAAAALKDVEACSNVEGDLDERGRRRNPVAGARSGPLAMCWHVHCIQRRLLWVAFTRRSVVERQFEAIWHIHSQSSVKRVSIGIR